MTKRRTRDPLEQIATARRVCAWCKPHHFAHLEKRSSDHARCNDFSCGCYCQDRLKVN